MIAIENLLNGESQTVEYKREISLKSERKSILRSVIAFANTGGGTIVIGIEDKTREIVGVPEQEAFRLIDALTNSICDNCTPAIAFSTELVTYAEKTLICIQVYPGSETPYHFKTESEEKGTYVRVNGSSRLADENWLLELRLRGLRRSYDEQLIAGMPALSHDEILEFCETLYGEAAVVEPNREPPKVELKHLLDWGLVRQVAGRYFGTNGFYLLRGDHPNFHGPMIACGLFAGTEGVQFVDRKEFSGSLFEQYHAAFNWINANLKNRSRIIGQKRFDFPEIPETAVRELLTNAICHRSYLYTGAPIKIHLFRDRLEIISPGPLPATLTVERFLEGFSQFRNPAIAYAFKTVRLIERFGSGIRRTFSLMAIWQLPLPEVEAQGAAVKMVLIRPDEDWPNAEALKSIQAFYDVGEKMPATPNEEASYVGAETKILECLGRDPRMSMTRLAKDLNMSVGILRGHMNRLRESGRLARMGDRFTGYWLVK